MLASKQLQIGPVFICNDFWVDICGIMANVVVETELMRCSLAVQGHCILANKH